MNEKELELTLLEYWKAQDIERVYKFKDCIYEYQSGDYIPVPLFADLGERLFVDIPTQYESAPNITYGKTSPLVDLISARGGRRVTYRIIRPRKSSDAIDAPRMYVTGQAAYDLKTKQFVPTFTAKRDEAMVLSTWADADELNNRLLDELEIEITLGEGAESK